MKRFYLFILFFFGGGLRVYGSRLGFMLMEVP